MIGAEDSVRSDHRTDPTDVSLNMREPSLRPHSAVLRIVRIPVHSSIALYTSFLLTFWIWKGNGKKTEFLDLKNVSNSLMPCLWIRLGDQMRRARERERKLNESQAFEIYSMPLENRLFWGNKLKTKTLKLQMSAIALTFNGWCNAILVIDSELTID